MAEQEVPPEVDQLVEKMRSEYLDSELAIANALADADEPLGIDELIDATGYTERTVKKRVDSLVDRLGGEPLIERDDDTVSLHPIFATAIANAE